MKPQVHREQDEISPPVETTSKKKKSKKMLDKAMVGVATGALTLAAVSKESTLSGAITGNA